MAKVIELYICSICGITNETHKNWGPICKKTGKRVCDECCYRCEYRVGWSGIWMCRFLTPEQRKAEAQRRIRDREHEEIVKATEAYDRRRQEYAMKRSSRTHGKRK